MKLLGGYSFSMIVIALLLSVATIGKPRKPLDGGSAAVGLILNAPILIYIALNLFR